MFASKTLHVASLAVGLAILAVGCAGRPSLFPNSDPALRKTSAQFAADAVKHFPYPATAPSGGELVGVANVDVAKDTLGLCNLSGEDWSDIYVWMNRGYVVHVPKVEAKGGIRTLDFQMIYNDNGECFPLDNIKYPVNTVEVLKDGKLYTVKMKLQD